MKTTIFFLTTINVLIFCGYSDTGGAADKVVVIPLHSKGASADSGWTDGGSVVSLADPDDRVCVGANDCSTPSANNSKLYVESGNKNAIFGNAASYGVYGRAADYYGVYGNAADWFGVYGNAKRFGVKGYASDNNGVYGYADNNYGVYGKAADRYGVYGNANNYGVYGYANNYGVYGHASYNGVYGYAANNFGGYFSAGSGNAIYSTGNIIIRTGYNMRYSNGDLKAFTIDHPLDPENKVLRHFSTEGPEALVIYSGDVIIDENGEAEVVLPDYFETLARNPRIQLTQVGSNQVYISEDISRDRFVISGDPKTKVYWQVTAERDDPKARLERSARPVEETKGNPGLPMPGEYISPDAYGNR